MKFTVPHNVSKAVIIVGIDMIIPYLIKSKNEYFTSYLFNNEENIIPAKAPVGIKKAPILLPIIEA